MVHIGFAGLILVFGIFLYRHIKTYNDLKNKVNSDNTIKYTANMTVSKAIKKATTDENKKLLQEFAEYYCRDDIEEIFDICDSYEDFSYLLLDFVINIKNKSTNVDSRI